MTSVGTARTGKALRRAAATAAVAVTLPGLIGVVGGSATAGAFSRPGLPVEYLDVPSAGMGRSIKEWSGVAGWNGRILNQYEAKGILVAALGMLAVHYGYIKPSRDPNAPRIPLDH